MSDQKAVKARNIQKRFGNRMVLNRLDFEVSAGEFVALLGPNGAGKTTFLRILAALTKVNHGQIQIGGLDLNKYSQAVRKRIGFVSHVPILYGEMTAEENLIFFASLYESSLRKEKIEEILELVGLTKRRRDLVRTFSRGMQQRLSIGRAILHEPQLLLLDEPYSGLDQDAAGVLDQVLVQVRERDHSIILTTHDFARAENLAARFDILSRGKIRRSISRSELKQDGLQAVYREVINESA